MSIYDRMSSREIDEIKADRLIDERWLKDAEKKAKKNEKIS